MVAFDDFLGNVEADSQARIGVDFGVAGAVEALEEAFVVRIGEADL